MQTINKRMKPKSKRQKVNLEIFVRNEHEWIYIYSYVENALKLVRTKIGIVFVLNKLKEKLTIHIC